MIQKWHCGFDEASAVCQAWHLMRTCTGSSQYHRAFAVLEVYSLGTTVTRDQAREYREVTVPTPIPPRSLQSPTADQFACSGDQKAERPARSQPIGARFVL